ncbi:MAG: flagellar export protein FliJ [Candidatus Abyssobacteria bacterium SURF_17]|uniref:Flagellar FliJ protein n=1 Tax=Candidatus Abyssobacteria bacterium SURF_17 TaxID=2093361 RepID=A0A419F4Y0_9BACT|nr:MAG: flagellar export protein FliJ [Candidatus Abyssubacteria bacterium SURF_17]
MKAYRFRFESVLKSKKIIVDELASKTARAQRILQLEQRKVDSLRKREASCMQELALKQVGAVKSDEVHRCHRYLQQLGKAIGEQENLISEIARRVDMLREMLVEAEKERKIFEKLDEKEREEFLRDFSKKERAFLDEVGTNRFVLRGAHERMHSPPAS